MSWLSWTIGTGDLRFVQRRIRRCSAGCLALLSAAFCCLPVRNAAAVEHVVLQASGQFDAVPGTELEPATAFYTVGLSARGNFRGEVVASPALFGGPDGNNPYYHFSTQFSRLIRPRSDHPTPEYINLGNFTSTDIEVAPITTNRSRVIDDGGTYQVQIVGPQKISFTWGDFIGGEAQDFNATAYFDPSPPRPWRTRGRTSLSKARRAERCSAREATSTTTP